MDVLILAGGDGTRIKTLTRNKQKALLKINNVSLLLHQVKQLSKISKTIYVSIKESDNQIIKEFKKIKRVKFVFIKEKKKLGTAGSLKELESFNIINMSRIKLHEKYCVNFIIIIFVFIIFYMIYICFLCC